MNPPKHELDRTTQEHNTPPPCSVPDDYLAGWVHATPAISPLPVCVINSHNGIAKVLRLTKGKQLSTFNLDHHVYNERSSIDTGGALH